MARGYDRTPGGGNGNGGGGAYAPINGSVGTWTASHAYSVGQIFTAPDASQRIVKTAYTSGTRYGATDTTNTAPWSAAPTLGDTFNASQLAFWRAALGNRDNAPATILVLADSIGEGSLGGVCLSPTLRSRWVERLQAELYAAFPCQSGNPAAATPDYTHTGTAGVPYIPAYWQTPGMAVTHFAASTAFPLNGFVIPSQSNSTTLPNGHLYQVTTAGTTAATEPTWPTTGGGTVTSGGVAFTEVGPWYTNFQGGATSENYFGPGLRNARLQSAGQAITFTVWGGTSCKLHMGKSASGGNVTVTVNSVSQGTVSCVGAAAGEFLTPSYTLIAGQLNTITVTWSSGSDRVCGLHWYNGDENKGIRVIDGSRSGADTVMYTNTAQDPLQSHTTWIVDMVALVQPALTILGDGVNDFNGSNQATSSSAYQTNLGTIITKLLTGWASQSILMLAMYAPNPTTSASFWGGGTGETWANYVQANYNAAALDTSGKVTIADLNARMPTVTSDVTGIYVGGGGLHPNNKGHGVIADLVARVLAPR